MQSEGHDSLPEAAAMACRSRTRRGLPVRGPGAWREARGPLGEGVTSVLHVTTLRTSPNMQRSRPAAAAPRSARLGAAPKGKGAAHAAAVPPLHGCSRPGEARQGGSRHSPWHGCQLQPSPENKVASPHTEQTSNAAAAAALHTVLSLSPSIHPPSTDM